MLSLISIRVVNLLLVFILSSMGLSSTPERSPRAAQNAIPKYPYDGSTTRFCAWWLDSDGAVTCLDIEQIYGVSMQDFQKWNPSIVLPCGELPGNQSFCLAAREPPTARSSAASTATMTVSVQVSITTIMTHISTVMVTTPITRITTAFITTAVIPTPVAGSNGVTTPIPYQPGMVTNCKTFHYVRKGETCVDIAARYRISTELMIAWNPYSRADCTRLLADTYCCVGVL